ncbi:hypothetical protein [Streptomyces sp. NPDC019937]|uniref:hypothetical protein n=1 Tax=Streptomyces sp. NPDC019937 TaxID=3154787 RepID=UPI0033F26321
MLAGAYRLHECTPGDRFDIGPYAVDTWLLPHFVPNAGIRLIRPGTDPTAAQEVAAETFGYPMAVAAPGIVTRL